MDGTTAGGGPFVDRFDSQVILATCPLEDQQHPTLIMSLDATRHQSTHASHAHRHRSTFEATSQGSRWSLLPAHFRSQLETKATILRIQMKPSSEDTVDQSNSSRKYFDEPGKEARIRTEWHVEGADPLLVASSQPLGQRKSGEFHLHRRQSHDATVGFRSGPSSPSLKTGCGRGTFATRYHTAEAMLPQQDGLNAEGELQPLHINNISADQDMLDDETMVESRRTSSHFWNGQQHGIDEPLLPTKDGSITPPLRRARSVAALRSPDPMKTPSRPAVIPRTLRATSDLGIGRLTMSSPPTENGSDSPENTQSGNISLFDRLTRKVSVDLQSPSSKSEGEAIAWSSSLETPPRPKTAIGVMGGELGEMGSPTRTPAKIFGRAVEGGAMGAKLLPEEEGEGEMIEWSSTLETPPKKRPSPNKRASEVPITPSTRKARVIDRLRGMPSGSPSTQERQRWIELQSGATSVQPPSLNGASEHPDTLTMEHTMLREWSPVLDGSDNEQTSTIGIDVGMHGMETDPSLPEFSLPQPPGSLIDGLTLPSSLVEDMSRSLPTVSSPGSERSSLPPHGATLDHAPEDAPQDNVSIAPNDVGTELSSQDKRIMARLTNTSGFGLGFGSLSGKAFKISEKALQTAERLLRQDEEDIQLGQESVAANEQGAPNEPVSEDDFGSLRVSQFDDTLLLTDSTQGHSSQTPHQQHGILSPRQTGMSASRRKSLGKISLSSQKSAQHGDHEDDMLWLSNNGHLLGDLGPLDESMERLEGDGGDAGHSTTTAILDQRPPETFGGFSTGKGKALKPASKEAMDKWSTIFQDDPSDASPIPPMSTFTNPLAAGQALPVMSGFTVGRGNKPVTISADKVQKWANFFDDDTADMPKPVGAELSLEVGLSSSTMAGFSGFSNGSGKKPLQPTSKEAQERARQLLEMDDKSLLPATGQASSATVAGGFGRPSLGAGSIKNGSGFKTLSGNSSRQAPGIASLRRTMGASSRLANTSGQKVAPMKAKLPFKPPTMVASGSSSTPSSVSKSNPPLSTPGPVVATTGTSTGSIDSNHSILPPPPQHRRSSNMHRVLHPNAKPQAEAALPPTKSTSNALQQSGKPNLSAVFDMTPKEPRKPLSDLYRKPLALDRDELLELGIHQDIVDMTLESAATFQFSNGWGSAQVFSELVQRHGVQEQYLSQQWVANHYSLIVWKLACYVRSWPVEFEGWFCPDMVVDQLLYRYEREVNRAERPALRKIVEGDESSQRHMVLCIAGVKWEDCPPQQQGLASGSSAAATTGPQKVARVKVTDGWYVLNAVVDPVLHRALERGKLRVGSKIGVCRAKLDGVEGGVGIFEASDNVVLRLHGNNTRLVPWETRLGFQRSPLWWTKLSNISQQGGMVPGIDVVILRKYPLLFLESLPDGTWAKRTRQEEDQAAEKHQEKLQLQLQDYAQQLEKDQQDSLTNPEALQEKLAHKAQELRSDRQVKPMFMLRVATFNAGHGEKSSRQALLTFWNDNHDTYEEGHRYRFTSVYAKRGGGNGTYASADHVLYLSADRFTVSRAMPAEAEAIASSGYEPRKITLIENISRSHLLGSELDLAVIVLVHGPPVPSSGRPFAIVTDITRQLLLVECPPMPNGKLPKWMKPNAKILLSGAKFKLWDAVYNIPVVHCVNGYTQVTYGGVWTPPVHQQQQQQQQPSLEGSINRQKFSKLRAITTTMTAPSGQPSASAGGTIIGGSRMSWPAFAQPAWEVLDDLFEDYSRTPRSHQRQREDLMSISSLSMRANELLVKLNPDV